VPRERQSVPVIDRGQKAAATERPRPTVSERPRTPNSQTLSAKTVLVADDTAFVRDRFRVAIEEAGHKAVTAQNGPELLGRLRTTKAEIDLIVLDLRLPQGNGVAMLRALRKLDQEHPPVMVFSGTIKSADEVRELGTLGVTGYVNEYMAVQHIVPALVPHLFPDSSNRRSSPRVVLGIPVAYRFGNTIAAALTLNISGGLAVRTTSPLAVGTAVKVRFRLPTAKKDIDAEATIAWTDRRVGMGVQFTKLTSVDQTLIDEYIQSHFFSNRKA
jgi:two-component system chemotaxis response regulator CheY